MQGEDNVFAPENASLNDMIDLAGDVVLAEEVERFMETGRELADLERLIATSKKIEGVVASLKGGAA